jgi:hypothetical protein
MGLFGGFRGLGNIRPLRPFNPSEGSYRWFLNGTGVFIVLFGDNRLEITPKLNEIKNPMKIVIRVFE